MEQGDELPAHVRDLLRVRVTSLEQLETVLLLRQSAPRLWSLPEISAAVRLPEDLAALALRHLKLADLASIERTSGPPAYVYAAKTEKLDQAVSALAQGYAHCPNMVVRLLSKNAIERVRSGAGRAFADAFVIRKRSKGG